MRDQLETLERRSVELATARTMLPEAIARTEAQRLSDYPPHNPFEGVDALHVGNAGNRMA
jgi:hypothetical protein